MKIGIMGSHGTGKSTKALVLAGEYKINNPELNVKIVTEVARQCPFPVNKHTTKLAQQWIFHEQLKVELSEEFYSDILVCDRTILDNLAYSRWAGFVDLVRLCLPMALDWMPSYNKLYFLRPNKPPASNGFRSTDLKFQADIDQILERWVKEYNLPVLET